MQFDARSRPYSYLVQREGGEDVIYINYQTANYVPSLVEHADVMDRTMDALIENPNVSRIVFVQQKNYNYDFKETSMLLEISQLYIYLIKQEEVLSQKRLVTNVEQFFAKRYNEVFSFLSLLKRDPVAAYAELKKILIEARIFLEKTNESTRIDQANYIRLLEGMLKLLEKTNLIQAVMPYLQDYKLGDREIYTKIFRADVIPNFTFTRLVAELPEDTEIIDQYKIGNVNEEAVVTILRREDEAKLVYHLEPPESSLREEHNLLLNLARGVLIEHQPRAEEFTDTERTRQVFFNISKDLLQDLAQTKGIKLTYAELNKLAMILVRHTIGFGLIEILLQDKKLQDIVLNSPISMTNIFVRHQEYDECSTNILPSQNDADSWAAKFRMISGRPLDEANPVLDTQLEIGSIRARIAIIQQPLSPDGLAYAVRRHREQPWTLPLFIKNKMINSFTAGLFSFMIDGARTILVAGTRSSGKTSLLGSLMLEIVPKHRIIVIEDSLELPVESMRNLEYNILRMKVRSALLKTTTEVSADDGIRTSLRLGDSSLIVGEVRSSVRGDQEVVIVDNGICKRIPIKNIEGKDISNCYVPTIGFDLKTNLSKITAFVKHPERNKLLKVTTKTGREVVVTHDHSLFTATKDFKIMPIECRDLKEGSQIIIPTKIPTGFNDINEINLMNELLDFRLENFEKPVKEAISRIGWKEASEICGIQCGDIYNYFRTNQKTNIPIASFTKLMNKSGVSFSPEQLLIKTGTSNSLKAVIPVNEDFCHWLGYYISEGYYDKNVGRIVITNSDEKVKDHITNLSERLFGIIPDRREVFGAGRSTQLGISCRPLAEFISKLGCGRICSEKRVPNIIYGLSQNKIAAFLRALYEGDGSITISKNSGNLIRYSTTSKKLAEDVSYLLLAFGIVAKIYPAYSNDKCNKVWNVEFKQRGMVETFMNEIGFVFKNKKLLIRKWSHSKANIVHFDKESLKQNLTNYPRKYRHLFRFLSCSKDYLKKVVNDPECESSLRLKVFASGDFYLDEITKIEEINLVNPEPVYDLSIDPTQNFVGGFGGILLHNTEAKALYEAMRIGALANVVAGTIHGASPYGVFDRVVNDLKVPATSFKATDLIIICNPVRTPDGLHSWKRVLQVAEIRKHWQKDPMEEKGFVDLLKYNVEKDDLEASDDLINGDSDTIKQIAANVRGWAGNWDAVYDNILLRGKIKEEVVKVSEKTGNEKLLEAEFSVLANHMFHKISDEVREEIGLPLSDRVFPEWQKWLMQKIKSKKI